MHGFVYVSLGYLVKCCGATCYQAGTNQNVKGNGYFKRSVDTEQVTDASRSYNE
tara:strand:- start:711 stop:872 length:162 start_codon:yes stop_codon:yes gene_type:complete